LAVCVSHNYAVLAWNMRGCSGRPNRFLRSYHSGFTDDLAYLVDVAGNTYLGIPIILVGFSVGGNSRFSPNQPFSASAVPRNKM
jgi:predicted alpha/beta-fold hydrolase